MKKNRFLFSILMFCSFIAASCNGHSSFKQSREAARQFVGTWQRSDIMETRIHNDSEHPDVAAGTVRFATTAMIEFFADKKISLHSKQEFVRYTPLSESGMAISEDDLRKIFSMSAVINGKYAASDTHLKVEFVEVALDDGSTISYEVYCATYQNLGPQTQVSEYVTDGESFTLRVNGDMDAQEVKYIRLQS